MYSKIRNVIVVMLMATSSIWAAGAAAGNEIVTYRTDDFGCRVPKLFEVAAQKVRDLAGDNLEGMLENNLVPRDAIDRIKEERHLRLPGLLRANPAIRTAILTKFETIRPSLEVTPETSDAMRQWLRHVFTHGLGCENAAQKALTTTILRISNASGYYCMQPCIFPLIYAGADINPRGLGDFTPLLWATFFGDAVVAQALIAEGADINARIKNGSTPLALEIEFNGNIAIIQALIRAGANLNTRNWNGRTPLDIAEARGSRDIAAMLRAAGAQ